MWVSSAAHLFACALLSAISFALGTVADSKMREEAYNVQIILWQMVSALPVGFVLGLVIVAGFALWGAPSWTTPFACCVLPFAVGVVVALMKKEKKETKKRAD